MNGINVLVQLFVSRVVIYVRGSDTVSITDSNSVTMQYLYDVYICVVFLFVFCFCVLLDLFSSCILYGQCCWCLSVLFNLDCPFSFSTVDLEYYDHCFTADTSSVHLPG